MTTLPLPIRAFVVRKAPLAALLTGASAALALWLVPNEFTATKRGLMAWDGALIAYLIVFTLLVRGATPEKLERRAAQADEGRLLVLFVSLLAAIASVIAIGYELGAAKNEPAAGKSLHILFAIVTVALSWFFVHASFASHYAHEYYSPSAKQGQTRGGLRFPGDDAPDFADFLHFSLVIGVAAQTADIDITSKALRRIVTVHGVAAFLFNTVILALTINLAAGLFT